MKKQLLFSTIMAVSLMVLVGCDESTSPQPVPETVTLTFRDASGHQVGTETIAATAIQYNTTLGKSRAATDDSVHTYLVPQLKNNTAPMKFKMTALEQQASIGLFGINYGLAPGYSIEVSPVRKSLMFTSSRTLAVDYGSVKDSATHVSLLSSYQARQRYSVPRVEGLVGQQYVSISSFTYENTLTCKNTAYILGANQTQLCAVSVGDSIIADAPIAVLTYGRAANGTLLGTALR